MEDLGLKAVLALMLQEKRKNVVEQRPNEKLYFYFLKNFASEQQIFSSKFKYLK